MAPLYQPKTENQRNYVSHLNNKNVSLLFAVGPAGTGKTLFACNQAISELKKGTINKIVVTRPVVPVEEDIGFLPGNINKKMDPWTRPIFDIFTEFYTPKDIELMLQNGVIEISPLAYMRGRTFKNSFIIADEMQNSSPNQMLMLATRIGFGSKMVVTGDLKQSDKGNNSGLLDFLNKYNFYRRNTISVNETTAPYSIKIVDLGNADIERSPIVSKVLDIYNFTPVENKTSAELSKHIVSQLKKNETIVSSITFRNNNTIIRNDDAALIPRKDLPAFEKYWWNLP
jgi:phosphate starvation-inducible PhoH-like protein